MAMTFAQKYPEAVQKLVVVDVAPVGYKDTTTNQEIIYNLMDIDLDNLKTRKEADEQLKPHIPVRDSINIWREKIVTREKLFLFDDTCHGQPRHIA